MNMSSFNHHKIYHKIKDDFQNKEIDSNIIDQKYLEVLINKTGVAKNCQELLMGKLYLVLSDQSHQKNIPYSTELYHPPFLEKFSKNQNHIIIASPSSKKKI